MPVIRRSAGEFVLTHLPSSFLNTEITPIPTSINAALDTSRTIFLIGSVSGTGNTLTPAFPAGVTASSSLAKGRDLPMTF